MKKNILIITLNLISAISLIGCQTEITKPQIEIAEITQIQLNDLLFPVDYGKLINLSLEADQKSLVKLIKLSKHTQGGGAYGFGAILQTIALKIGDDKFAQAVKQLSKKEIENLHSYLLAGFEYGDPQYQTEDFAKLLPQTYQLTKK